MNKYNENDYENALECLRRNKYSKKAKNVFYYAPECYRVDMYSDFEEKPDLSEDDFMAKYKALLASISWKKSN